MVLYNNVTNNQCTAKQILSSSWPYSRFKSPLIECNAWKGKEIICSSAGSTCLSQQYLRFSRNLCSTQNIIYQNEMNYDSGKLTNSVFLFHRVRRLHFSSIQPYKFANLQEQVVPPFVFLQPVFISSPLFLHCNEFPLRSRNQSCLIINCWSAMTCLFHFHSVVVDVAGAD